MKATITELETRRQALALDAQEGKSGAAAALDKIEADIAALRRGQERQALAETGRAVRDAAAAAEAEAERRRELSAEAERLGAEILAHARKVDGAGAALVAELAALRQLGERRYHVVLALGRSRPRLRLVELVDCWARWTLREHLPSASRPERAFRRPLAALVGGSDTRDESD
jgi:hypothetical protein